MPTKIVTETQLMRLLANSPLQINITLVSTETYTGKNTPLEHLHRFYKPFGEIKNRRFDGLIVTGAPVETIEFEEVKYWPELEEIFDFAAKNVTSTIFHICWGAQAALYHYYGIEKRLLDKKLFGVFKHKKLVQYERLLKGMDDEFCVPHSRHTTVHRADIDAVPGAEGAGRLPGRRASTPPRPSRAARFSSPATPSTTADTLEKEYLRDEAAACTPFTVPANYYPNDDDTRPANRRPLAAPAPICCIGNWLNYFVYQTTPYDIMAVGVESTSE